MEKEIIKVSDKHGFVYEVVIEHSPQFGFSTAIHRDRIIGQVESSKLHTPFSDNDKEWEEYEERLEDWKCDIKINLESVCKEYFNNRKE